MNQRDEEDRRWLAEAIRLARRCQPVPSAYNVGAVIVTADGSELASGFSRELGPRDHAEEVALRRAGDDPRLATATIYSSLEPCSTRASRPTGCAQLIVAAGIARVVIAWREPTLFVDCHGVDLMRDAGVEVVELGDLAPSARAANAHLPLG